jgi:hypothetical protein
MLLAEIITFDSKKADAAYETFGNILNTVKLTGNHPYDPYADYDDDYYENNSGDYEDYYDDYEDNYDDYEDYEDYYEENQSGFADPLPIDPYLELDVGVLLSSLAMGVPFPSSVFYVAETGETSVTLKSINPEDATLTVTMAESFAQYTDADQAAQVIYDIGSAAFIASAQNLPGFQLLNEQIVSLGGKKISNYEGMGSFSKEDGRTYYIYRRTGSWNNLATGNRNVYHMNLYVRTEIADGYKALFVRIRDGLYDVG